MEPQKREIRGKDIYLYIIFSVGLTLVCNSAVTGIFKILNIHPTHYQINDPPIEILTVAFPFIMFLAALTEEIFFRLPLALLAKIKVPKRGILTCALVLSIIFGYCHGGSYYIFVQGVSGVILSMLFLECGGYQGKIIKPIMVSATAHFLFNGVIAISLLIRGVAHF